MGEVLEFLKELLKKKIKLPEPNFQNLSLIDKDAQQQYVKGWNLNVKIVMISSVIVAVYTSYITYLLCRAFILSL